MGNSILVLLAAIVLLWLAVTGRLPRLIDALDVVKGTETASGTGSTTATPATGMTIQLPNIPIPITLPIVPSTGTINDVPF